MKRMAVVLGMVTLLLVPGIARAGSATDAALGLGAFAVFNQIVSGTGVFGAFAQPAPHTVVVERHVVVERPVVVQQAAPVYVVPPPPPTVVYPAPAVVYPAPTVVYPAPVVVAPQPVFVRPGPPYGHAYGHRRHWSYYR